MIALCGPGSDHFGSRTETLSFAFNCIRCSQALSSPCNYLVHFTKRNMCAIRNVHKASECPSSYPRLSLMPSVKQSGDPPHIVEKCTRINGKLENEGRAAVDGLREGGMADRSECHCSYLDATFLQIYKLGSAASGRVSSYCPVRGGRPTCVPEWLIILLSTFLSSLVSMSSRRSDTSLRPPSTGGAM